jgi:hypothetical protein
MSASSDTFDPSIQSENIAFRQDELINCDACKRPNPPNRLECIYCGRALDVRPEAVDRVNFRQLESWEPGTSIVIRGGDGDAAKAAELLSLDAERFEEILSVGVPLPVAWVEDRVALVLVKKLQQLGFACSTFPDSAVAPAKPPIRLGGMHMGDEDVTMIDLNTRNQYRHSWNDIVLIVQGLFATGRVDSTEKRRLRKTTVMSETTISADELVVDLYTSDSTAGYRVQLSGFDYSCLGDQMARLATDNMTRLIDLIRARSPEAKLVDDYRRIRHLLTGIWDVESRKDPKGLQQVGLGRREFGVVHSTSNVEQFTRFSRLQRLML